MFEFVVLLCGELSLHFFQFVELIQQPECQDVYLLVCCWRLVMSCWDLPLIIIQWSQRSDCQIIARKNKNGFLGNRVTVQQQQGRNLDINIRDCSSYFYYTSIFIISVSMSQDIQRIIEDNIYLKKNLQLARHQQQQQEHQIAQLTQQQQHTLHSYQALTQQHQLLQQTAHNQQQHNHQNIATLQSQIHQLKHLIEQKQLDLQQFQLKIIPNLDQDMLRVKIISEMEAPYQQMVDKKDKEILRLKEKLSEADRKNSVLELHLQSKEKEWDRQTGALKKFYEEENGKYRSELNKYMNKKESKSYDKQLFKAQRKELQELRYTLQLQLTNEDDLRKQITALKIQKEKVLMQVVQLNEKKALQVHFSPENHQIRTIKADQQRLEEENTKKDSTIEKAESKVKQLEKEIKKNEDDYNKMLSRCRQQHELQKENLKEELWKCKEQNRRMSEKLQRQEEMLQQKGKGKTVDHQWNLRNRQMQALKETIRALQRQVKELESSKRQKISLSKNLQEEREEQQPREDKPKKRREKREEYQQQNERNVQNRALLNSLKQGAKKKDFTISLQKSNARLKEKLQLANKKIVQLIRQKAGRNKQQSPESYSRERAFSNIEMAHLPYRDKAFLLQFRDASFIPLVQPTLFTQPY